MSEQADFDYEYEFDHVDRPGLLRDLMGHHDDSIPAKPHWEYGGTFDAAWRGVSRLVDLAARKEQTEFAAMMREVLRNLAEAHVVTIEPRQVDALPLELDILTDFVPDPRLPFKTIYVSTGKPNLAGILYGTTSEESVLIMPFIGWEAGHAGQREEGWQFGEHGRVTIACPIGICDPGREGYSDWVGRIIDDATEDERQSAMLLGFSRAMAVVRFLESANVDFEDTPVSRQVRRQAQRKGTPISQRVYVRSPRYRRQDGQTEHGHIDFSHRFEVRGHYKHYGPDTRLFRATERDRPHKIIEHPKMGPMVRIWCPDFVKGPPDLPLVPKTRVYKKDAA